MTNTIAPATFTSTASVLAGPANAAAAMHSGWGYGGFSQGWGYGGFSQGWGYGGFSQGWGYGG